MKLNLEKCAFGVGYGKFLDFMVSHRGIEANLEKIKALTEMQSPTTVKEVQQLTSRVAALNRFISRAIDKCLPFFKVFRKAFIWNAECEEAFQQLKKCMANPLSPLLSTSRGNSLPLFGCLLHCSQCRSNPTPGWLHQPRSARQNRNICSWRN